MTYDVAIDGQIYRVELLRDAADPNLWAARVNNREFRFNAVPAGRDVLSLVIDGRSYEALRESVSGDEASSAAANIVIGGIRHAAEVRDPRALRSRRGMAGQGDGPRRILSPMPGKVVRLLAAEGTKVASGAGVVVIEAMKMQNELKSPKDGVVKRLAVAVGAAVNAGDVLAVIE